MCIRAPTEGWSATDELLSGKFELARAISLGLVLAPSPEGHTVVFVAKDPAVGDRSARHVACQVLQHLIWVTLAVRRYLNEDIPIRLGGLAQPGLEFLRPSAAWPSLLPDATCRHALADENRW